MAWKFNPFTLKFDYYEGAGSVSDGSVTNAKLADMAQATIKLRAAGAGTGPPIDGTSGQVRTILGITAAGSQFIQAPSSADQTMLINVMSGDQGSGGTVGLAPAQSAGDAAAGKFLKADGTWTTPPATAPGVAVADASGGAVVDAECRAQLNALLASLRTAGIIAT